MDLDSTGKLTVTSANQFTKDLEVYIKATTGNASAVAIVTLQAFVVPEE